MSFGYCMRLLWHTDKWTVVSSIVDFPLAVALAFCRPDLSMLIVVMEGWKLLYLREKVKGILVYWLYEQEREKSENENDVNDDSVSGR